MQKLGMKTVPGIVRVQIRKSKNVRFSIILHTIILVIMRVLSGILGNMSRCNVSYVGVFNTYCLCS